MFDRSDTNLSCNFYLKKHIFIRSSSSEVFLGKGVPKTCSKFTGENQCLSLISIKLRCNFIEIARRRGCSLLHIFRTRLYKNASGELLLFFSNYKIVHGSRWARDIFSRLYFAFLIIFNTFTYFTTLIRFSFNYFYVALTARSKFFI